MRQFFKNHFFIWLLPLIWAVGSRISFLYPGDEYLFWVLSSLPGIWLVYILKTTINLQTSMVPWMVILIGVSVTALAGFFADRLKVNKPAFILILLVSAAVIFALQILSFPSLDDAVKKHGPLIAYITLSVNLALYLSYLLSIFAAITQALANFIRNLFSSD